MQRTHGVSCSGASGMCSRSKSRLSSAHFITGTRPSGGSTTIDRRRALIWWLWSANSDAGPTLAAAVDPAAGRGAAACGSGASNGVASKLSQMPWRSGCPSGVLPWVHLAGVCAAAEAHQTRTTKAHAARTDRRCIGVMSGPPAAPSYALSAAAGVQAVRLRTRDSIRSTATALWPPTGMITSA